MFFAVIFVTLRMCELITLIPVVGMLGHFVNIYSNANALTPDSILILFIVSVLALVWAFATLFFYHRSSHNANFISFIDILIFGALIAGIYYLRAIGNADCTSVTEDSAWTVKLGDFSFSGPGGYNFVTNKTCAMLKASWAFAIINTILFFNTAIVAYFHGDREEVKFFSREPRRHHSSRHSHRSHSGSRHSRSEYSDRRRVYV